MKRIGCFFGTFDPVHIGHLIIAQHMLQYTGLEEVWLVVSPQNPFKQNFQLTEDAHRLKMAELALASAPKIHANGIELKLPKPSYTCATLDKLREENPDIQFDLIMGSDNFAALDKWKNVKGIMDDHRVLVYPRPGLDQHIEQAVYQGHPGVNLIDAPMLDISATRIRHMLSEGKDVRFLVADPVREYLIRKELYASSIAG